MYSVSTYILQLGFTLELACACLLHMIYLNHKPHFLHRFLIGLLANIALVVLIAVPSTGPLLMLIKFSLRYAGALALVLLCCDIPFYDALFCSVCGYAVQHLASSLCLLLEMLIGNISFARIWYHPLHLCVLIPIYLISWSLFARHLPVHGIYEIGRFQSLLSAAMILSLTLILNTFAGFQYLDIASASADMLYIYCLLYDILCCIFVMMFQLSQRKAERAFREKAMHELIWKQQQEQYAITRETIDIINHKCHDLKHQVVALQQMSMNDSARQAYLDELHQSLDIYDCSIHTGSDVLDTVLTEKLLLCKQNKIELTCMADGKLLSFISAVDLYTVFGNAIDNAIESVLQISNPEKRVIAINVFSAKGMLIIQSENYYEHELTFRDGVPLTTKEQNGYHGFGVTSIRYAIEKYGGFLTINGEQQLFLLRITIPLPDEQDHQLKTDR